jgi:AcrR family transcriptional regulator
MPKVTEAHIEARRAQIIQAACKCFSDKGFHQTTVRDICHEAGLSAGAVYGYFKNKEAIVEAMAEMGRQNTRALLTGADPDEPALRSLVGVLNKALNLIDAESSRRSMRLDVRLWGEALHSPQLLQLFLAGLANVKEPLADAVRQGQKEGDINAKLDPGAASRVLAAICLGFVVQKAMEPDADLSRCSAVVSALLEGSFTTQGG